jgi:hypothetical protein
VKKTSIASILVTLCLVLPGCQKLRLRPGTVPSSAVWVDGNFIDCASGKEVKTKHCTVYDDTSGEILADGLFTLSGAEVGSDEKDLKYAGYRVNYLTRSILLQDSRTLFLQQVSERDPTNRLINDRLRSVSSEGSATSVDCGESVMNRSVEQVSECANAAFQNRQPFRARYRKPGEIPYFSYGLASTGNGDAFEVVYDMRGLLQVGLRSNEQVFDDNRIKVISCTKPVKLGSTEEGTLVCVIPVNEVASVIAAQQKPIGTTVCAIAENPAAFNNKMVRIKGHVSGNFEYSVLDGDGCSKSLWFTYGEGDSVPGLVAHVPGDSLPGAEDPEGKRILPVPVKLVRDSSFRRFQNLMHARVKADARAEKSTPDKIVFHRVTATFIGRIDGVSSGIHEFHLKRKPRDRADGLGFGQMGLFDAQLVVQSVQNDAVLDDGSPN